MMTRYIYIKFQIPLNRHLKLYTNIHSITLADICLLKVFHSVFLMKSQYTDSITGDIIIDLRSINKKFIDCNSLRTGSRITSKSFPSITNLESSISKYSSSGISIYSKGGISIGFGIPSIEINNFTLSYWAYDFTSLYSYSSPWGHVGIKLNLNSSDYYIWFQHNVSTSSGINVEFRSGSTISHNKSGVSTITNTWNHYALCRSGTTYYVFRNGSLIKTINYTSYLTKQLIAIYLSAPAVNGTFPVDIKTCFDDIVLINNQALWTSAFNVPNTFLTGEYELPKRFKNKSVLYSKYPCKGDYFDKAYLY